MVHKVEQKWDRPERSQVIRHQVVRDLYDRSRPAIIVMLVMLGVIRWAIDPVYWLDPRINGVFALLIAITLVRFVLAMIPQARRETLMGVRAQLIALTCGIALSSLSLGALVVLTWPLLDPARIAIVAVVTSGLVSGAVMSLGFSPLVYMTYMLPPVGALFVMAVTDNRPPWGASILATFRDLRRRGRGNQPGPATHAASRDRTGNAIVGCCHPRLPDVTAQSSVPAGIHGYGVGAHPSRRGRSRARPPAGS